MFQSGKTYCVITKLFGKYVVHRFPAEKTLYLFGPLHPLRMWSVFLQTNILLQYVVTIAIICNCVMLTSRRFQNPTKYAFFGIFLFEILLRSISRGLLLHPHSLLRIPWRWLDIISMIGSAVDIIGTSEAIGVGTSLFRTFRLIHILKTISIIPGLKVVISGLLRSLKMVKDMFFITICLMIVFSLLGKMVFEDSLSNKCVRTGRNKNNQSNWYKRPDEQYELCGLASFANICPLNYTCQKAGTTPYGGLIGFDTIGSALFTVWRMFTLDSWEELYNLAISARGPPIVMYFVLVIFLGSFFLMNLPIAMVISSYATEVNIAWEEESNAAADLSQFRKSSEFFFNVCKLNVKIYDPNRKPAHFFRRGATVEPVAESEGTPSKFSRSQSKVSSATKGKGGLAGELHEVLVEEERGKRAIEDKQKHRKAGRGKKEGIKSNFSAYRELVHKIVSRPAFGVISAIAIMISSIPLIFLSHEMDPEMETFVNITEKIFKYLFITEMALKIFGMGRSFFNTTRVVDFFIVVTDLIAGMWWDVKGISILRLWLAITHLEKVKFLRNLILLQKVIMGALANLVYLVLLLILTIFIFAVIGFNFFAKRAGTIAATSTSSYSYSSPWSFTDFIHSLLIVFRILCGEWFSPFWECFKSTDKEAFLCSLFFFSSVICIHIVLLNLILGVLLDCFDETHIAEEAEETFRKEASLEEKISSVNGSETKMIDSHSSSSSFFIPYLSHWLEKIWLFFDEDRNELTMVVIIIVSSMFQCFEDSFLENGSTVVWLLTKFIYVSTSLIFLLETLLKLLVQGMSFKFGSWWNVMELILSMLFVLDMAVFRSRAVQALRVIRAFRLLQPFTAPRRWRGLLFSASVLRRSINTVIHVLIVVIYFWLVFSVVGVSLYRGRLYRCTRNRELVKLSEVADKSQCLKHKLQWENNPVNFDDVGKGFFALFQVADSSVTKLLTTNYLMKYYLSMKRITRRRPHALPPRPVRHFENMMYDIVTSTMYEKCIVVIILLYLVFDVIVYLVLDISKAVSIQICKMVINYVFLVEVLIELHVYKLLHLKEIAKLLDFSCVVLYAITSAYTIPSDIFAVDPLLFRLCRAIKTDKTLLNIMPIKQLRRLFLTLQISLTSVSRISLLLGLVMFVYAIIGMNLFGESYELSRVLNFKWIMPSMMLLFPLSTAAGWNRVFEEVIRNSTCGNGGSCALFYSATVYFSTYVVICSFVLLNMFVAVVLENFTEIQESRDLGFEEEDLDILYRLYSEKDPYGTGFIPLLELSDFFSSAPDPFTIGQPNIIAIIVADIPVYRGFRVHFVDICSTIFISILNRTGENVEQPLKKALEPRFLKVYPERKPTGIIGSTRRLKSYETLLRDPSLPAPVIWGRLRQTSAVTVIQRGWRYCKKQKQKIIKRNKNIEVTNLHT